MYIADYCYSKNMNELEYQIYEKKVIKIGKEVLKTLNYTNGAYYKDFLLKKIQRITINKDKIFNCFILKWLQNNGVETLTR